MPKKPLSEQTMLITGASSGIGRATAKMAAAQGATLILCARSAHTLDALVEELGAKHNARAEARALDVGDEAALMGLAQELEASGRSVCSIVEQPAPTSVHNGW